VVSENVELVGPALELVSLSPKQLGTLPQSCRFAGETQTTSLGA
jgi:hypothetical protein